MCNSEIDPQQAWMIKVIQVCFQDIWCTSILILIKSNPSKPIFKKSHQPQFFSSSSAPPASYPSLPPYQPCSSRCPAQNSNFRLSQPETSRDTSPKTQHWHFLYVTCLTSKLTSLCRYSTGSSWLSKMLTIPPSSWSRKSLVTHRHQRAPKIQPSHPFGITLCRPHFLNFIPQPSLSPPPCWELCGRLG